MSTRKVDREEELYEVLCHVETCIQKYMNKNQAIEFLYQEHNIEPIFTQLVWQKLEEENQEFFQAYHLRLKLKDQITQYNHLLENQILFLQQKNQHGVVVGNGSHVPSSNNNASYYVPEISNGINGMKTENMHRLMHGGEFNGYGQFITSEMQHYNTVSGQNMNMNGVSVAGPTYSLYNPEFVYGGGMESHMLVSSYGIMDSLPPLMEDDVTRSSQLLLQFSHDVSNFTPDFTNTTDKGFPRSTCGPYFPPVDDDEDDISRLYNNNNGYHDFGRDS